MYRSIAILAIIALFIGCKSHKIETAAEPEEYYDLSTATEAEISDIFSDVEAVPLLFEGDYYPNAIMTLINTGEHFIVQNYKSETFVFDRLGHYISSSKDVYGQGPGEYAGEMATCWNPYNNQIIVMTPNRLMAYDMEFNFIGSSKLPTKYGNTDDILLFTFIYPLSSTEYLIGPSIASYIKHCFINFDFNTGELGDRLDYSHCRLAAGNMQQFYFFTLKNGEMLFAPPCMTHYVYAFDPATLSIERAIKYDMGDLTITQAELDAHTNPVKWEELEDFILNTEQPIPARVLPTPDKLFFVVRYGRRIADEEMVIADRRDGSIKRIPASKEFPMPYDVDENIVYTAVDKATLLDSPDLLIGKDFSSIPNFDSLDDETFIVLKYKIR